MDGTEGVPECGHDAPVSARSNEADAVQVEQRQRREAGRVLALNGGRLSGRSRAEAEENQGRGDELLAVIRSGSDGSDRHRSRRCAGGHTALIFPRRAAMLAARSRCHGASQHRFYRGKGDA